MPLQTIVVVRHATRLDKMDPVWKRTSATPYDPPLAEPAGIRGAHETARHIAAQLRAAHSVPQDMGSTPSEQGVFMFHSSPFLRCVQTAAIIAQSLASEAFELQIRLDAVFGEWQTADYFTEIAPPPPDGHLSIAESSSQWCAASPRDSFSGQAVASRGLDTKWPLHRLGDSGEYGESWAAMHERFNKGLHELVQHYDSDPRDITVVLVTHGAGCNSLLGILSNQPLLTRVGLGSFAVARRIAAPKADQAKWSIIHSSSPLDPTTGPINLSASSSFSSYSDLSEIAGSIADTSLPLHSFGSTDSSPGREPPEEGFVGPHQPRNVDMSVPQFSTSEPVRRTGTPAPLASWFDVPQSASPAPNVTEIPVGDLVAKFDALVSSDDDLNQPMLLSFGNPPVTPSR